MSDYGVIKWTSGKSTDCDTQEEAEHSAKVKSVEYGFAYAFSVEFGNNTKTVAVYINGVRYAPNKHPE